MNKDNVKKWNILKKKREKLSRDLAKARLKQSGMLNGKDSKFMNNSIDWMVNEINSISKEMERLELGQRNK